MPYVLLIASLFFSPILSIPLGCLQNATFSNQSNGIWLANVASCQVCACRTFELQATAYNCLLSVNNTRSCWILRNYSYVNNGVEIISSINGSLGCFFSLPTQTNQLTTERPTTVAATTAVPELCSGYTLSTVLLKLVNASSQSYTNYTFVYRATATRATFMFCFLNRQHYWALDDVSIKHSRNGTQLLTNGGFETGTWSPWIYYCINYYGSGMHSSGSGYSPRTGTYFYYDAQYSIPDGIFQNITMIPGENYTISFFLANPSGGNFSLAVVSIGP